MADKTVEFKISVKTDGTGPALDTLRQKLQNVVGEEGTVAASAEQSSARQVASHRKVSEGVQSISTQLDSLKGQMLGLVGVGVGVQGVKDLAALADSYKNLEARIKLTTGEGKSFDTAFQGVFDVAKRTNSAVEETGVLFTKLAESGKAMGVSQQDALALTETINQSIQLSGASAEASKASIVQLIQGLQSGVLRGDEFNSVMEQSPRLAKALADGLGVTTGELRKMAEEGKLTSDVIISSLQKQSDTIAGEFGKLPATVGRAMTNLSTEFTRYVGEADKAGGYTTKLATVIDALAGNLSTVATVMIHTGQALGAMKLLSMAQEWLSAGAAIKSTAAATEAATVSTVKNTVVTVANTAAQATNAAAWNSMATSLGGVGPQLSSVGNAANAAKTPITAFGSALNLLKGFAVLDIALHFKEYGTAIGEAAAKLMGYKDRTEELARADKLADEIAQINIKTRRDQARALKEATDRSFDLGKAGAELVGKFDEMRLKGDSAAEAIGKIGKDFDLANVPGIKTAVSVLDKLAADGKISATEFQKAWADALKGEDLAVFETRAMAAFKGTSREAERMGQIMDASLRESIRRAGLDFELISGGMGKASASAINDTEAMIKGLDRLKAMGVDTAQALTASIGKSINTAESQKALEAVKSQIEAVRKALGDKVADGLLDQAKQKSLELKDALEKAMPGIQSVSEAMGQLGLKSTESLQLAAKSATDAFAVIKAKGQEEGESYVAWQSRKQEAGRVMLERAIAANRGVADSTIVSRAAMEGLEIQTDSTGKSIVRAMSAGGESTQQFGQHVRATTEDLKAQAAAMDAVNAKYARPKGDSVVSTSGGDREKFLAGQNAVDNSLQFTLLEKLQKGTLGAADVEDIKRYLAAQKQQNQVNKDLDKFGGGFSTAGSLDRMKWEQFQSVMQSFIDSQKNAAPAGTTSAPSASTPGTAAKTYNVTINTSAGVIEASTQSDAQAQALIKLLQNSKLSSGY